jgi:GDSL-like lipase/acylhydrolase family protein
VRLDKPRKRTVAPIQAQRAKDVMTDQATRNLSPRELAPFLKGALHAELKADYLEPARLPGAALAQSPDPGLTAMVRMMSGVRLAFETNSPFVALDLLETGFQLVGEARHASVFDLLCDGTRVARVETSKGPTIVVDITKMPPPVHIAPGEPALVRFDDLPARNKCLEIWLPHTAMVRLRALHIAKGASIRETDEARLLWAHYGSSISHGMEADGPSETWPAVAARKAGLALLHLGFAGQCHVDGFVARAIRDSVANLVSLKLGINVINADSMRERAFKPAVHNFLDTIREKKATTPIMIISPILCPAAESNPGPTIRRGKGFVTVVRPPELAVGALSLQRVRALLQEIVEMRRAGGDANLHYLGGLELFGDADVSDLPDGLHPNAAGLQRMGLRFAEHGLPRLMN